MSELTKVRQMGNLNYFEPYISKAAHHEDQLTRAFLVVLRYSPVVHQLFLGLVQDGLRKVAEEKKLPSPLLPAFHQLPLKKVSVETQTGKLGNTGASQLLSVLLTDEQFEPELTVQPSERGARYDGLIRYGDELLLIIENKPRSYHVWEEQLHPNLADLSGQDVELIELPAIVEWKRVIGGIGRLLDLESMSGAEFQIINDFLQFVSRYFGWLYPYDNFDQCFFSQELVQRRIGRLLEELASSPESVEWRPGWAWAMRTALPGLHMFGVELHDVPPDDWALVLSFYYGDTQTQAASFWRGVPPVSSLASLLSSGWNYTPLFHLSFMQSHLVYFNTRPAKVQSYWEWWRHHGESIHQHKVEEVMPLLEQLAADELIELTPDKRQELKEKITGTNRKKINICPCARLQYSWSSTVARQLDRKGLFASEMSKRIRDGILVVDPTGESLDATPIPL